MGELRKPQSLHTCWTATDHAGAPPPAPAQLILRGGQSLVVSGHSQSWQLTGLGKSLPLTCQQQPSLNYKRRVYLAYMKNTF